MRTIARLARQTTIKPLETVPKIESSDVTLIIPVLNEVRRLTPLMQSLQAIGDEVVSILVVDGGSTDGTRQLVQTFAALDDRIRFIEVGAPSAGWNGKAWNMHRGLEETYSRFVLFLDADVTIARFLTTALRSTALEQRVAALSVATQQLTNGAFSTALHAALLTNFVYRQGRPGRRTTRVDDVMANGQVYFAETQALRQSRAIEHAKASRCDDLTITHALAADGNATAFVEAGDAASVTMYTSLFEMATNWPRSLALIDQFNRSQAIARLADTFGVLVLPQIIVVARPRSKVLMIINYALLVMRFGTLAGTAQVYANRNLGYWLSPLADIPATCLIIGHALLPRPRWRGRTLVAPGTREDTSS